MIFYSRNITLEALKSNTAKVKRVIFEHKINDSPKIIEIKEISKLQNIPIEYLNRYQIESLAKSSDHQGVAVEVELPDYQLKKLLAITKPNSAFIYISTATYEQNIGAIVRSAEAAGFSGVIIPRKVKISGTIARTSAGAIFHIPVIKESIFNSIKIFKENSFLIVGIERNGNNYTSTDLTGKIMLIIGGEDKSLSENVRTKCNEVVEIPQFGKVNSLNMSVAASIVIYEKVRQDISQQLTNV